MLSRIYFSKNIPYQNIFSQKYIWQNYIFKIISTAQDARNKEKANVK